MKLIFRILTFILSFFLLAQVIIPSLVPTNIVYNNRIKYNVFKDNPNTLEAAIIKIRDEIKKQKLEDYVIILGDSVGFSVPCEINNSITFYLNNFAVQNDYKARFFNLSIPSESPGDIYTIIKLLDRYGISTNHLIINLNYFEFLTSTTDTSVFWLKRQLRDVDEDAYNYVYGKAGMLKSAGIKDITEGLKYYLDTHIAFLTYKDYIRKALVQLTTPTYEDLVGDTRPWYEKKDLPAELRKSDNMWYFSDKPMVFDETHSNIYFINKIVAHQESKDTLIFLAGYNRQLLPEETSKKGYNDNLKKIDQFFAGKPVNFVNYDRKIDYNLYADFVHLIPAGYKCLAEDLWTRIKNNLH